MWSFRSQFVHTLNAVLHRDAFSLFPSLSLFFIVAFCVLFPGRLPLCSPPVDLGAGLRSLASFLFVASRFWFDPAHPLRKEM